jgi:hypothetical protein
MLMEPIPLSFGSELSGSRDHGCNVSAREILRRFTASGRSKGHPNRRHRLLGSGGRYKSAVAARFSFSLMELVPQLGVGGHA